MSRWALATGLARLRSDRREDFSVKTTEWIALKQMLSLVDSSLLSAYGSSIIQCALTEKREASIGSWLVARDKKEVGMSRNRIAASLAFALCLFGAVSVASAAEAPPGAPTETPGVVTPASLSQCSAGTMCIWEGKQWVGNFAWWPQSSWGCHSHAGIAKFRSWWNRTQFTVRLGGWGKIPPGAQETFVLEGDYISGEVCWPE
jgi:uncharacterized membrane protein